MKDGFKVGLRHMINLDGCFLKMYYGGHLLVTTGIKANDCIYRLTYAIMESKNYEYWYWFLLILKMTLT